MKRCVHPIKASRTVEHFLSDINTLTYEDWDTDSPLDELGFHSMKEYPAHVKIERLKENNFNVDVSALYREGNIAIGIDRELFKQYNSCFNDLGFKQVRADAIYRHPHLKGYSILTFVLLHELGHLMTDDETIEQRGKYSEEYSKLVHKYIPPKYWNYFHAEKYNERLATDWAAKWLLVPENGKRAKQFEKEFFVCYKGE